MSEKRIARNEAWIASLVLHVTLLAGVIALVGRPKETADGPVVIETRARGHEISVVLLDRPAAQPVLQSIAVPVRQDAPPVQPIVVPPPPPTTVRPVSHQETVPAAPIAASRPSADAFPPANNAAVEPGEPVRSVPAVVGGQGSPLSAGTTTEFFGVPAIGKSVVFVLDRSASMGLDGRLDRARRELAASLRRLPPSAKFQVVVYNKSAVRVRVAGIEGLLPVTPEAIEAAIATVDRLPAEGSSEHAAALVSALGLAPDVIYFLTDEDDLEMRDVQVVTRKNHNRVSIHTLCLVAPASGESPMQALARTNRGQFKIVGQ